jgi:hypothetical protein
MLHRVQDAPNVDVEGPAILFFADFIERTRAFHAGIVEGDIETAMGGYDEVDGLHDVGILGDVCADKGCRASGLGDLRGDVRPSFSRRPVMTTFAPASAKASGVALPIPKVPSVTSTILLVEEFCIVDRS